MIRERLESFQARTACTLLGVGPMSKNCVDATIELANTHECPLLMIASRRQIEAEEFGGGYVNRWSTESFAKYVTDQDRKGKIILARDHGGPWQNTFEVKNQYSLRKAMETAKRSYEVDIESGFDFIHIDPSVDIFGPPAVDEVLERIFELYEFCWSVAQRKRKEIVFEIGTEEQSGTTNSLEELEYTLKRTVEFCEKNKMPPPAFIVIQTGTRVMETRNVGSFDSPFRIRGELPAEIQIPKVLDTCRKYKILMKEHNTDYLSDESLSWHPRLGIHAANVAPEFGVEETRAFIALLHQHKLERLEEAFIQLSYESRKWEKWMMPNTTATDRDRAIISGHYVFADPRFAEIKAQAQSELNQHSINVDTYLKEAVKQSILRYMRCFKLTKAL